MTADTLELLSTVAYCQVAEMEKWGEKLDPNHADSCQKFWFHVRDVQSAIIHSYKIIAFSALREPDPKKAAGLWGEMSKLCEKAMAVMASLRSRYPQCGTSELYDLVLDYKIKADERYSSNLEDWECSKTPPPKGLFPSPT